MATILGTVGVFGFEEDQQGILLESQDIDYKPDTKVRRDYRGVKVGIIFYDDQTDISMKGYIPRENPTDIKVAQTLTLANSAPAYGLSSSGSGTNVVTGIKIGMKNEDLATFEVTSTIGNISSAAADMEQTSLAFRVVLKDAEAAAAYVDKLRVYAAETPFEFGDISDAGKTLLSMRTAADKSVEVIHKLGDIASVSGKPLRELAFLYAKVQNSGLSNEVAESLEMQGVPIRKLIAEMKGITFEDVFKGISKHQFNKHPEGKCTTNNAVFEKIAPLQRGEKRAERSHPWRCGFGIGPHTNHPGSTPNHKIWQSAKKIGGPFGPPMKYVIYLLE